MVDVRPTEESVREFIGLCRSIARTQLLVRRRGNRSYRDLFGIDVDDLATDSIADLFQRNSDGEYVQIRSYFESMNVLVLSEQALLAHLRRLVCSKVNNHIMALSSEHDPSFWKVLRNCKLAIQALRTFTVTERYGELYITPCTADPLTYLPAMDQQDIEQALWLVSGPDENIPTLLSKLSRYLQEQQDRCRTVGLFSVAAAIRMVYVREKETGASEINMEDWLHPSEITAILRNTCSTIRSRMKPQYLGRKGVRENMFDNYFLAIERHLADKYISNDGYRISLFEYLRQFSPELTRAEYQDEHRSKLEYLLRLVENDVLLNMKAELG